MDPQSSQSLHHDACDLGSRRVSSRSEGEIPGEIEISELTLCMDPKLIVAAMLGNVTDIRELVQKDPKVILDLTRGFPNLIMDPELRKATTSSDVNRVSELVRKDPKLLFGIIRQLLPFMNLSLRMTVRTGDAAEVEQLVRENPQLHSGLGGQDYTPLDPRLLEAATLGNVARVKQLENENPDLLNGVTPNKNTVLHIAVLSGHEFFAKHVCTLKRIEEVNEKGETPVHLTAITGHYKLARFFTLTMQWSMKREGHRDCVAEVLTKINRSGDTALHLALRYGHTDVALLLLRECPGLSGIFSKSDESPLFMAASRGFEEIVEELLKSRSCHLGGPKGQTALHVAAANGQLDTVEILVERRPFIVVATTESGENALHVAAAIGHLDVVKLLLKHDVTLAHALTRNNESPLWLAASGGHINVMQELIWCSPGSMNNIFTQRTILHEAINKGNSKVVEYILKTPVFQGLINQPDKRGNTPLHMAARNGVPKILRILLADKRVDRKALNLEGQTALAVFNKKVDASGTLQWNEAFQLLANAIPSSDVRVAVVTSKWKLAEKATKEIESLTKYTNNTTVVATLMATVTFAAAFTVPGGYKSDNGPDQGQAVLAKKVAFQVFLVSNVIAMCSSLAVAFLYILMTNEDREYLLHYKATTKKLMWCAFVGLVVAFATGMYAVVAPDSLWISIFLCALCCTLPLLTYFLARWPLYAMMFRICRPWVKLIKKP